MSNNQKRINSRRGTTRHFSNESNNTSNDEHNVNIINFFMKTNVSIFDILVFLTDLQENNYNDLENIISTIFDKLISKKMYIKNEINLDEDPICTFSKFIININYPESKVLIYLQQYYYNSIILDKPLESNDYLASYIFVNHCSESVELSNNILEKKEDLFMYSLLNFKLNQIDFSNYNTDFQNWLVNLKTCCNSAIYINQDGSIESTDSLLDLDLNDINMSNTNLNEQHNILKSFEYILELYDNIYCN